MNLYRVTFSAVQVDVYHAICMEGFGIHSCWHDKDLDKDTAHDEGCAEYGELRRGLPLDEWCSGYVRYHFQGYEGLTLIKIRSTNPNPVARFTYDLAGA